jgi:ribosome-binding protein aMBF1 (putative translation factor)
MKNNLQHQDWNTIVFSNKNKKKEENEKKTFVNSKTMQLEKKVENDDMKHKFVPLSMRQDIIKHRNALKLTQKELANRVNLPQSIINEIESGKAIYNHVHINKIKRTLKF